MRHAMAEALMLSKLRTTAVGKQLSGQRSLSLLYVISVIAGLLVWQLIASRYSTFVLATPPEVAKWFVSASASGDLPAALGGAFKHMLLGFFIALVIAVPIGFLTGRVRFIHELLDPVLNLAYAVPAIAWAPLIMIWFGLFFEARVALVVVMCVFDMIIVIDAGARNVDMRQINVGRSFGASRWQTIRLVLLPASAPYLFAALRIGVVRAVNAMITAELFLAAVNLGQMMKQAAVHFDSAGVLGVLFVISFLGLIFQELLLLLEKRVCNWLPRV